MTHTMGIPEINSAEPVYPHKLRRLYWPFLALAEVCREVVLLMMEHYEETDGRLAVDEEEAAAMLCLKEHVLRDERLRGRIRYSKIVAGRIRYQRVDLIDYLVSRRIGVDQDTQTEEEKPKRRRRYTHHSTGDE